MSTLDIVTATEAAAYLGQPVDRSMLARWCEAISARIDDICGPVVQRDVVELHDGGNETILLRQYPVASITTITEYVGTSAQLLTASTNATQPLDGYLLSTADGMVRRQFAGCRARFPRGSANVEVDYVAGRFDDTEAVTQQFKTAALIAVSHAWQAEHGTRTGSFGGVDDEGTTTYGPGWVIPRRALDLLGAQVRPRNVGVA